jgi:hypothetical protein
MSSEVTFSKIDSWLLYCIPKPGGSLSVILRSYWFIIRTSPPSYEQVSDCLAKALDLGIVEHPEDQFVITPEWYETIHSADDIAENEIVSLMEFESYLLRNNWHPVRALGFVLDRLEYENAIKACRLSVC